MEYIKLYIGGLILWLFTYMIIKKILSNNNRQTKKEIILSVMFFSILTVLSNISSDNIIKGLISYILMILFSKIVFKERLNKTIVGSFVLFLLMLSSEVIIAVFLSIILKLLSMHGLIIAKNTIEINFIIPLLCYILVIRKEKTIKRLVNKNLAENKGIHIIIILIITTLSILIFKNPITKRYFNSDFLTLMVLLVLFCSIGIFILKQQNEADKITDKYRKLADYSKNNEGLLEEYRKNLHENNNQLIIINNMIPKKNKEAHEYIEGLIKKESTNKYYWLNELKYVPTSELKGFMNFKIIEMVEGGLKTEINISRELDKRILKKYTTTDKEDLYNIVGVLLDNAQEASKGSKEKVVSIQLYMENKFLKLIVANTYKGKINLDKIDDYGYSTKGSNRGTGLHIVKEIVDKNKLFEKETTLIDNYFVQMITIK